jgi:hydroxymethylpyrimidine/phosphomethylpyrimidine kinase
MSTADIRTIDAAGVKGMAEVSALSDRNQDWLRC